MAIDLVRAQREGVTGVRRRRDVRLSALRAHARRASPFYRRHHRDVPDTADLSEVPPVTKTQLMAAFDEWVTDPDLTRDGLERFVADQSLVGAPYRDRYFVCTSSGTTGHPGLFVQDRPSIDLMRAMTIARVDLGWVAAGDWPRLAARRFRWAAVVGTGGHFAGTGWIESERRRGGWRARSYRSFSVQRPLAELTAALDAFDPAILTAYPSALLQLAEEQARGRMHLRPLLVETAGESSAPADRLVMETAFGCRVHDAYAASECQWLALDCAAGWLHVNADWVVLEPVDLDQRPTPPGEPSATVLLTNLVNHVQPLIRYDLGDSVLARPDPCPCGSPLPAIRVAGRCDDVLRLRDLHGATVRIIPLAVGAVVQQTPGVLRSQLVQVDPTTLRVRLDPEQDTDVERMWADAVARLHGFLAGQGLPDVSILRADEPPEQDAASGKLRQVIVRSDPDGGGETVCCGQAP